MFLLSFLFLSFVSSQSPVFDASGSSVRLTNGTNSDFLQTFTSDRSRLVFIGPEPIGGINTLYSIVTSATSSSQAVQLSPTSSFPVTRLVLTPNEDYVLFRSAFNSSGSSTEYFSVPINGGAIAKVTPPIPNGIGGSQPGFRPCLCSRSSNDQSAMYMLARSNVVNNGRSFGNELWGNTVSGNNLVRLSISLNQSEADPVAKSVRVRVAWPDYIMYTANPGPNGVNDPTYVYLTGYSGNNRVMSPPSFAGPTAVTFSSLRQPSGCADAGRYIAFTHNTASILYSAIFVYDTVTGALLNSGKQINPIDDTGNTLALVSWSSDGNKLYFTQTIAGFDILYEFNTANGLVGRVNSAYTGVGTTGTISVITSVTTTSGLKTVGDFLVYVQAPTFGNFTPNIYAFNTRTGGAAIQLSSGLPDEAQGALSNNIRIMAGQPRTPQNANTAVVVYAAYTNSTTRSLELYSVPVSGGLVTKLSRPGGSVLFVRDTPCFAAASSDPCAPAAVGCPATPCSCPVALCSNYLVFSQLQPDEGGVYQFYSVQTNGPAQSALLLSPSSSIENIIERVWLGASNVPFVTFSSRPVSGFAQLYTTSADSTPSQQISRGIAAPATSVISWNLKYAPDGSTISFTSITFANISAVAPDLAQRTELFAAFSDGSAVVRINPTLQSTDTVVGTYEVSPDGQKIVFFVRRNAVQSWNIVTSMYVASGGGLINLTPAGVISTQANPNDALATLSSALVPTMFDCASTGVTYPMTFPASTSAAAWYFALFTGSTYALTSNSSTVGDIRFLGASSVAFTANPGGTYDTFINSPSPLTTTTTTLSTTTISTTTISPTTRPASAGKSVVHLVVVATTVLICALLL